MSKPAIVRVMKRIFANRKYILLVRWIFLLGIAYCFLFYKDTLFASFESLFFYPVIGYLVYFVIVSLRGITFIPLTTILLVMVPFTNHWILLATTIIGTLITSYIIYRFSEALDIDDYFEKKYPRIIKKLRHGFNKYEYPIIIWRSLFPFTPTDLVCYLAGTLEVDIRKMLIWVAIGETVICSIYIRGINSIIA